MRCRIVSDLLAQLPIQADEEYTVPLMYGSGMNTNETAPAAARLVSFPLLIVSYVVRDRATSNGPAVHPSKD
ncbi:MAG TPA: hypothetical protein VFQ02_06775 [Nitrospira sp.]|nr:hypothetical protein [Nitrospira sp.]